MMGHGGGCGFVIDRIREGVVGMLGWVVVIVPLCS
jgi:hypothetical protein